MRPKVTWRKYSSSNRSAYAQTNRTISYIFHREKTADRGSYQALNKKHVDAGEVGKFLSVWGKKRVFFSPILELARFFGMTSAKTDQVQVGFSQKDRGVALFYLWLSVCTILLYFALSASLHGVYLVQRNFSGCIRELHYCVIYVLPNGQSHKDWKCVSFYKHNMDFLKKLKQRPRNFTSKHISTVSILRNRSVWKRKEEIASCLC